MPVIGHAGISALATADDHPDLEGLVRDIQTHIDQYYSGPEIVRLKLCEFRARIQTLDQLLAAGGFTVPTDRIAALNRHRRIRETGNRRCGENPQDPSSARHGGGCQS